MRSNALYFLTYVLRLKSYLKITDYMKVARFPPPYPYCSNIFSCRLLSMLTIDNVSINTRNKPFLPLAMTLLFTKKKLLGL